MVLIGPVLLWAILRSNWRLLRTPWPYLGALAAILVFSPNILWNARHDWLTMGFQLGHGFSTEVGALAAPEVNGIDHTGLGSPTERLASLLGYLGIQIGFWGLITLPLLLAPWRGRWGATRAEASRKPELAAHGRALLIAATLFPLGFFALVALVSQVEANWPAMYLLSAAPLAALWLRRVRCWALAAAGANLLLVSLYAFHAATSALPLPDSQNRILRETHGFRELAEVAAGLDAPVYADRYQLTAMLRFYRPDLDTTQWPGLTRPSEYLYGRIAPRVNPAEVAGPFWLVTRFGAPPAIAGFRVGADRTLQDCPSAPTREAAASPCQRPLHTWHLYRYQPAMERPQAE